jgi:hypothetical protein
MCVVAITLIVPKMMAGNAREQAARQVQQVADQFKTIRAYYTRNVIKKVVKSKSLKPSFNHKNEANGVPLPATFIHDVSKLLEKKDMKVNLYSGFPLWQGSRPRGGPRQNGGEGLRVLPQLTCRLAKDRLEAWRCAWRA